MDKKVLAVMCLVFMLNAAGFAQQSIGRPIIVGGHAGTAFSDLGVLDGIIIGANAEYYFFPFLSAVAHIDVWLITDIIYAESLGLNLHFLGPENFDPYLGCAVWLGQIYSQALTVIDVPAVLGVNIRLSDAIGIQVQGRLYLLSLPVVLIEADLGLFYQF
ncbi:MAG: hypothetical protein JW822_00665 [Spirochaetales bacterium]|nr:hypothetical protein [Spirochaetales bacterium]